MEIFCHSNSLTFNVSKSVVITFVKSRFVCVEDSQLVLNHNTLPWKSCITHLGVILDELCNNASTVEDRVKKFCGAVNSVVPRLGGIVSSDQVWMKIVDTQLFSTILW